MRGGPAAAGGLLADEFAKVSEDSSHSSFEVVYDACDGIASRYLARPEGGPCPLTSHDSWVEREGDEEQLGHAVVAGSRDGPVEHPRSRALERASRCSLFFAQNTTLPRLEQSA